MIRSKNRNRNQIRSFSELRQRPRRAASSSACNVNVPLWFRQYGGSFGRSRRTSTWLAPFVESERLQEGQKRPKVEWASSNHQKRSNQVSYRHYIGYCFNKIISNRGSSISSSESRVEVQEPVEERNGRLKSGHDIETTWTTLGWTWYSVINYDVSYGAYDSDNNRNCNRTRMISELTDFSINNILFFKPTINILVYSCFHVNF